jgi:predicted NAD/FAD-binding protein
MKIAIVGSGISGLTAAHYLHRQHDVTLFEANDYLGGHTNTVEFELAGREYAIDTGFIVFNDRTYPNFCNLLDELGVSSKPTSMTFSVSCEASGLEYRGADLNGLFAQRANSFSPKFLGLLWELLRFNRQAEQLLAAAPDSMTVGEFFARHRFGRMFVEKYFLPMASAIWSCPHSTVEGFPIRFIADFYRNHGLLSTRDRPQWRVINGGSQRYVEVLARPLADSVRMNSPVTRVERTAQGVQIRTRRGGEPECFDHLILACHSDQALAILGESATQAEREVLSGFPYEKNLAVLHTDTRLLPRNRRAWACWNYHSPSEGSASEQAAKATVTYNMNLLQGVVSPETFCVSLNCGDRIDPSRVIRSIIYHHPVFTAKRRENQRRHGELIGPNRTSYCGAYWGNGFHEDGVNSALAVCRYLDRKSCSVASTQAGSDTADWKKQTTPFAIEST